MDTRDHDPAEPEPERPRPGEEPTEPKGEAPEPAGPTEPQDGAPAAEDPSTVAGPQSPAPEAPVGGEGAGRGEAPAAAPRRLTRSGDDRVIGGVCGGVARYFGVDATLVRIGAVALALFGGAGALLYLAGLILMPGDPAEVQGAPASAERPRALAAVAVAVLLLAGWPVLLGGGFLVAGLAVPLAVLALFGLLVWWLVSGEGPRGSGADIAKRAALGIGVLIACGVIAVGGALGTGLGGGTVAASLVILAGVMLVAGAFVGGARWLILPALSLALAVGLVSAAGIDFDGGVGEREYRPASADALRDGYRLGMGELVVDLRDADLPAGDTPLALDVGVGAARLIVPEDVCVASAAEVGIGGIELFDRSNGGVDLDWEDRPPAAPDASRVVVDAEIGVGALHVSHDRQEGPGRGPELRGGFDHGDGDEAGNVGCRGARAAR